MLDDPAALLEQGLRLHQQGQMVEAEALYRAVLTVEPHNPDALHLLGLTAHQTGRSEQALTLIEQAVEIAPHQPYFRFNLGTVQYALGRQDSALESFRAATMLLPTHADAHYNLAFLLEGKGLLDEAAGAYRQVLALTPERVDGLLGLAAVLYRQGMLDEAEALYDRARRLRPDDPAIYSNLGAVYRASGQLDRAVSCCQQALALDPTYAEAHHNLGNALREQGRGEEAAACFETALTLDPRSARAHTHLGNAIEQQGRWADAVPHHKRAIELDPGLAEAHLNLATALQYSGQFQESLTAYERALEIEPENPQAHFGLALLLLRLGDTERGWKEYEWRWRVSAAQRAPGRDHLPLWDGSALAGRSVLIESEQGFGDAIQFVRYIPGLAAAGGRVTLESRPELARLFASVAGVERVVTSGDVVEAELRAPLMSLPRLLSSQSTCQAGAVPYLAPPRDTRDAWRLEIDDRVGRLKVGLLWATATRDGPGLERSVPTELIERLIRVPNTRFFSLDVDPRPAERPSLPITALGSRFADFADTALAISALDLVVCIDTAVAHLAGALGKPVWIMLPFVADWRWLVHREDSPWYPTARLFRQPRPGDWGSVIERVKRALEAYAQAVA